MQISVYDLQSDSGPLIGFWYHVLGQHGLDRSDYKNTYKASPLIVKSIIHCNICKKDIYHEYARLSQHFQLEHPDTSLEKYFSLHVLSTISSGKSITNDAIPTIKAETAETTDQLEDAQFLLPPEAQEINGSLEHNNSLNLREQSFRELDFFGLKENVSRDCGTESFKAERLDIDEVEQVRELSSNVDSTNKRKCINIGKDEDYDSSDNSEWANQCLYSCKICSTDFQTYKYINYHIVNTHKLTMEVYTLRHGNCRTQTRLHKCKICCTWVINDSYHICRHLQKYHNLSLSSYEKTLPLSLRENELGYVSKHPSTKDFTPSWTDQCIYECRICFKIYYKNASFAHHLSKTHNISRKEYKDAHGTLKTKALYHRCLVCEEPILCQKSSIECHLQSIHSLSFAAYDKMHDKKEKKFFGEEEFKNERKEKNRIRSTTSQYAWMNQCQYECQICKEVKFNYNSYTRHIESKHKTTLKEYTKKFGGARTKTLWHQCIICQSEIVNDHSYIKAHLRKKHKITPPEYDAKLTDENKRGRNVNELKSATVGHVPAWSNKCVYHCKVCSQTFDNYSTATHHIHHNHNMSPISYSRKHGYLRIKTVYHKCNICPKVGIVTFKSNFVKR